MVYLDEQSIKCCNFKECVFYIVEYNIVCHNVAKNVEIVDSVVHIIYILMICLFVLLVT